MPTGLLHGDATYIFIPSGWAVEIKKRNERQHALIRFLNGCVLSMKKKIKNMFIFVVSIKGKEVTFSLYHLGRRPPPKYSRNTHNTAIVKSFALSYYIVGRSCRSRTHTTHCNKYLYRKTFFFSFFFWNFTVRITHVITRCGFLKKKKTSNFFLSPFSFFFSLSLCGHPRITMIKYDIHVFHTIPYSPDASLSIILLFPFLSSTIYCWFTWPIISNKLDSFFLLLLLHNTHHNTQFSLVPETFHFVFRTNMGGKNNVMMFMFDLFLFCIFFFFFIF